MTNRRSATVRAAFVAGGLLLVAGQVDVHATTTPQAASAADGAVVVPLSPARILDTRSGNGAPAAAVAPGQTITLQVSGRGGVPANATGVVLNLTINGAEGAGFVSAYPTGESRPDASVINYTDGEDIANMVTAALGSGGRLDLYNAQGTVHLIADVAGYLVPDEGVPGPAGPQGAVGPQGPVGPAGPEGALRVVSVTRNDDSVALTASPVTVISVIVPAGAWLVHSDLDVTVTGVSTFQCTVDGPSGTLDTQTVTVNGIGAVSSVVTADLPSGGTVSVSCSATGGTDPSVNDRRQSAILVDSFTQQ